MLAQQAPERFEHVLGPKILGARHLHLATLGEPLDHFVLFSSAASLLGSPGQSSYSAGNAYLDALAHHRRAQGLPALSVNWGVFSTVGLAAQASRAERLDSRGLMAFAPSDAWRELGNLLDAAVAQIGFVPLDARQWADFYPQIATSTRFRGLAGSRARGAPNTTPLRAALAQRTPAEIARDVHAFVREQVAHVLRMEPTRVHVDVPFKRLGLDSLGTLELRNRLENGLGLRLSATLAYTYPDARAMAEYLIALVTGAPTVDATQPAPIVAGVPDAASPAQLAALSDDELARLVRDGLGSEREE
jgi:acyl carrier protein